MTLTELLSLRLRNQQIAKPRFKSVKKLVSWMGAMQAQDYAMAKWGIGLRLEASDINIIESAIYNADIIRTHLLRPTWHFVSSDDIYWMLELTAAQIKQIMKSNNRRLEITEAVIIKSNKVIEKALTNEDDLGRDRLREELGKAKVRFDENRLSHLLMAAELDGLICSRASNGNKQTYSLLERRVPVKKALQRDEALAELAKRYFNSHAPATVGDFAWWSGLTMTDARKGLELNKKDLISENIDDRSYWSSKSLSEAEAKIEDVFLLPAYDEFVISYKNRTMLFDDNVYNKAVSNNGIFKPIILTKGQASGIWKRTTAKEKIKIELELFRKHTKKELSLIKNKAEEFGRFLGKEISF